MKSAINIQSGERLSFYKLFKEKNYRVSIPIIQRDYAQGRKTTKEVRETFLEALFKYLEENKPKGEYVIVIAGATDDEIKENAFFKDMTLKEHVEFYTNAGMSKMEAIKAAARDRGVPKGEVYREMI